MQLYVLFIHDDRYSVPSVDTLGAENDIGAAAAARRRLTVSRHYRGAELWEDVAS